jgi:hypothetical protein
VEIERHLPKGLRHVDDEKGAGARQDAPDPLDVGDCPDMGRHVGDEHQLAGGVEVVTVASQPDGAW